MSDIKKLLETMDRMSASESKPTGPKFPGYWKGTDPASKAKDKMVGGTEESVIKDLHKIAKEKVTEWNLLEKFNKFKEQSPDYTGIDPTVRQRMGMPPASQSEIQTYLDKNPPVVTTGTGEPVRSSSGAPVVSGGQTAVGQAADQASPDRAQSVAREPTPSTAPVTAPTVAAPAAPAQTTSVAPVRVTPSAAAPSVTPAPTAPIAVTPPAKPASVTAPYRGNQGAREIQTVNPSIKDVNKIQVGQRLKLPDSDEDYVVQRGDTLDKIGKMYRSGEIGGRVVGGDGPTTTPAARPQPAAPASTAAPAARPQPAAPASTATQTSATSSATRSAHPEGTTVKTQIRDPNDPSKPLDISLKKGADGKWYDPSGRRVDFNKPGDLEKLEQLPGEQSFLDKAKRVMSGELPSKVFGKQGQPSQSASSQPVDPKASPTPATRPQPAAEPSSDVSNPTVKLGFGDPGYTPIIGNKLEKRSDGKWYFSTVNVPVTRPEIIKHAETQLAKQRSTARPSSESQPVPQSAPSSKAPSTPSANSSDAMASYATRGGRVYAADFNNPSGLGWDGKGKYTSYKTPEEGVNATRDLVARYLTDQTPYIKGSPTPDQVVSTWVTGGKTPADKIQGGRYLQSVKDELAAAGVKLDSKGRIPYSQAARDAITRAIVRHETAPKHMEKFAPFLNAPKDTRGAVEESNKEDEKIAGRYDPDDFDLMVKRLGQRAREQDRKHGPVDIAALAKRLRAIEKREQTKEQEDPAVNMQDPDIQRTSQTSPQQDPAAVKQQQLDQTVDMATAKGTMSGLKNVLGPKVDTNALASAVTKISDGKPLTAPESMSMSALTPLISKAAETPQTAMALKTALGNAGMLAKQGK